MSQKEKFDQKILSILKNVVDRSEQKKQTNKYGKKKSRKQKDQDEQARKLFQDISSMSEQQSIDKIQQLQNKSKINKQNPLRSILSKGKQIQEPIKQVKQMKQKKKKVVIAQNKNTQQKINARYIVYDENRKWNQNIINQKKGKFDPQEKRILLQSLTQCIAEKNIQYQAIVSSLSEENDQKIPRNLQLWSQICGVLKDRSLVSCYKFLKRSLSNKKGKWTQQQTEQLKQMVQKYGKKWSKISKQLGRTSENVRDKYRTIGEDNNQLVQKTIWRLEVLVQFLKLLQKYTKTQFLMQEIKNEIQNAQLHNRIEMEDMKKRKKNSRSFLFHNNGVVIKYIKESFKSIKIENVEWKKISQKLKVKTIYDCRNKFVQLLQYQLRSIKNSKQIDKKIIELIVNEKYKNEKQIKWQKLILEKQNIDQIEAKNRWMIIKKQIEGRSIKTFQQIIDLLKKKYSIEQ